MKNLPFGLPGRFYRGNLHTHSTNSDGMHSPEYVCNTYKEKGYDFISLSEHFIEYYNYPISDTRHLRDDTFTTLIAAELHQGRTKVGEKWHILAVGLPHNFAKPTENETAAEISQRAAEAGAFIGIVHPSWYGLTTDDAKTIRCAHAVEIYNHGSKVEVERGEDWPFCDLLLNEGWRLSGFATDDAHSLTHDAFGGWIMVQAGSLNPEEILSSMKAGRYYSSTGPDIYDVRIDSEEIHIACDPVNVISAQGRGSRSKMAMGECITRASFPLEKFREDYIRLTITTAEGKHAWTNPIWFN